MKSFWTCMGLLCLIVMISGCGGSSDETETIGQIDVDSNFREIMLRDVQRFLIVSEGERERYRTLASEGIQEVLESYDGDDGEQFSQLADLIEQDDVPAATALYLELGGEPIEEKEASPSDLRKVLDESDRRAGVFALFAASIYLNADFEVPEEDRTIVADSINMRKISISEDNRAEFTELADSILFDDREAANSKFQELHGQYIPDDKRDEFERLTQTSDADIIDQLIEEIIE